MSKSANGKRTFGTRSVLIVAVLLPGTMSLCQGAAPALVQVRDSSSTGPLLSLDSVLARVRTRNPELRMWEEKAQARSAQAAGAKALMAPEFGAGGFQLPYGKWNSDMETPGDKALMVTARQMFPGWGKRESRERYLASLALPERSGGAWMRAGLLADAKGQYFRMATTRRRLAVLGEAESIMAYMLKVAEARFKHRQADLATVEEARARLQELRTMRTMENSISLQAASSLALLMADTSSIEFSVDTSLGLRGYADQAVDSIQVESRPDLAQVDDSLRSMELNLEWMRRQARPDFGVQYEHMEMFDMGRRYSLMGMMTLPAAPWSKGMYQSDVKAMKLDIQSMRSGKQARRLMALRMARETHLMIRAEAEQYRQFAEVVVPSYRAALDAAMATYQEGSGDLFRVLDIWDRWLMARMTALEHFGKTQVLEAEYERETGLL